MSSLPKLRLGERREFMQGSYELRGCIDNRYVFRIRNRVKNRETYVLWTESQWRSFVEHDEKNMEFDNRNAVMFQLHLDGRTYVQMAADFNLHPSRVREICAGIARKRKASPVSK